MRSNRPISGTFCVLLTLLCSVVLKPAAAQNLFQQFGNNLKDAFTQVIKKDTQSEAASTAPLTTRRAIPRATVTKTANVRSGPGTSNAKVGSVAAGTQIEVLSKQGDWYNVKVPIGGKNTVAWIYAPLVDVTDSQATTTVVSSAEFRKSTSQSTHANPFASGESEITYFGYSEAFLPIKSQMEIGKLDSADASLAAREAQAKKNLSNEREFARKMGLLHWLERGTVTLDRGEFEKSTSQFENAELILDDREGESILEGLLKSGSYFTAETLVGNEEMQGYTGEGYERVLMLNYKSIGYLLQGKRKAYNVTRRAIDWQNMEKKAFEKKLREANNKLKDNRVEGGEGNEERLSQVGSRVAKDYAALDAKASRVPSAYVNPFGYYVSAMIQEYESYDDWSLRDNAKISYNKALELNPKSSVLRAAARDMADPNVPGGSRLVHVVAADGFVPEKKLLAYQVSVGAISTPVKLGIYQPVRSSVARIEVQTAGGHKLATLSSVADIEAICLRHQKDSEPFRQLRVALAIGSGVATKTLLSQFGLLGNAISEKRESMAAPDMRSWMSLPASIQAARLRLKKGVTQLKLVSFDSKGNQLASRVVKINGGSHDFVYARSLNKTMYAHASGGLWMLAGQ